MNKIIVLNSKFCQPFIIDFFTDVALHISWPKEKRREEEKREGNTLVMLVGEDDVLHEVANEEEVRHGVASAGLPRAFFA